MKIYLLAGRAILDDVRITRRISGIDINLSDFVNDANILVGDSLLIEVQAQVL